MTITNNYNRIRKHSEILCKPLLIEDYVVQVVHFASPAKWHLAHTTWFFEVFILKNYSNNYIEFNKDYSFLFNSYYNNVGDRILRTNRGNLTRPTVEEIYNYRAYVNENMLYLLEHNSNAHITELVTLGLNHEQQHQELLLTDIKYMFGHHPLFPVYDAKINLLKQQNKTANTVFIKEGIYEIGYKGKSFCYDNELGEHKVYLNDFNIQNSLVTNY